MASFLVRFKSCRAMVVVTTASMMPSGISLPSAPQRMAGLVIRWPTLRRNMSERPCRRTAFFLPLGAVYSRSALSPRVKVVPPLLTDSVSVACKMPSQLL
ncbi:hypothetical protein FQZ97_1021670 [compost metagenome]